MLNPHDITDKRVIATVHEYKALSQKRYTITQLPQPYQRGWRRSYVLSERALHHPDRPMLESILEVIGSTVVHHSRTFQRRRGRSRTLCEIEQPLRPIPIHEWQNKRYPDAWLRLFRYELLLEWNRHWQPYWVFAQPSLYRLKIGRNWVESIRQIDPTIEIRLSELERWLENHRGWQRYRRLKGQRRWDRWCNGETHKQRQLTKEHRREIASALLKFPEFDPAASVRCVRSRLRSIHLFPGVAQCRGSELRPRPVRVQVLPPGPWNANRTSEPGFPAKEVVPPTGMRCKSSTFRPFSHGPEA
ncbi:MAG: hypothetical protein RLZ97_134 [Verrucomicrobiota bacterium]